MIEDWYSILLINFIKYRSICIIFRCIDAFEKNTKDRVTPIINERRYCKTSQSIVFRIFIGDSSLLMRSLCTVYYGLKRAIDLSKKKSLATCYNLCWKEDGSKLLEGYTSVIDRY